MHTATSKVENSAQVAIYSLKFVLTPSLSTYTLANLAGDKHSSLFQRSAKEPIQKSLMTSAPVKRPAGWGEKAGGRGPEHHEVQRREGSGERREAELARKSGRKASGIWLQHWIYSIKLYCIFLLLSEPSFQL